MDRSKIEQVVLRALRSRVFDNRGTLTPPQLPQVAATVARVLAEQQPDIEEVATQLTERGLALVGLQTAGVALQRAMLAESDPEAAIEVAERLSTLTLGFHKAEGAIIRRDQEQMRAAVMRALDEQRGEVARAQQQEERLMALVQELSTPIIPVYDGILVVPLVGSIDSRRAMEIMERLLMGIVESQADVALIDITGITVIDTAVIQSLLQTARAAQLLGASAVMVGVNPEVAQTITQLGVNMQEIPTLSNLQAGIVYALNQRGLAIQTARTNGSTH